MFFFEIEQMESDTDGSLSTEQKWLIPLDLTGKLDGESPI